MSTHSITQAALVPVFGCRLMSALTFTETHIWTLWFDFTNIYIQYIYTLLTLQRNDRLTHTQQDWSLLSGCSSFLEMLTCRFLFFFPLKINICHCSCQSAAYGQHNIKQETKKKKDGSGSSRNHLLHERLRSVNSFPRSERTSGRCPKTLKLTSSYAIKEQTERTGSRGLASERGAKCDDVSPSDCPSVRPPTISHKRP